jgi:hypothetical protein
MVKIQDWEWLAEGWQWSPMQMTGQSGSQRCLAAGLYQRRFSSLPFFTQNHIAPMWTRLEMREERGCWAGGEKERERVHFLSFPTQIAKCQCWQQTDQRRQHYYVTFTINSNPRVPGSNPSRKNPGKSKKKKNSLHAPFSWCPIYGIKFNFMSWNNSHGNANFFQDVFSLFSCWLPGDSHKRIIVSPEQYSTIGHSDWQHF